MQLAKPARGPGGNRTRDPPVPREPQDNSQFEQEKSQNLEFLHLTAPIPAEGRASQNKIAENLCTSTAPILAEGRAGQNKIAKTSSYAPRPRPSPQRVMRAKTNSQNTEFLHLDHANPRRGSREPKQNRKKPRFCSSTAPIPAEGRFSLGLVGTTPPP